jgi:cation diffusion facilitator family transporter
VKKYKHSLAYLQVYVSIIANLFLSGLKYWAGIMIGSIALIADAWHSISDSVTSLMVFWGVKFSEKPADRSHPFGHGRAELIATIMIGVLLSSVALAFVQKSIAKLLQKDAVVFSSVAFVVLIASILVKELLAQFAFWAGRKIESTSLRADAWHHRSDSLTSVIILIGIIAGKQFWWIDGVLGLVIAGFLLYTAFRILKDAVNPLLGQKPDDRLTHEIQHIIRNQGGEQLEAHHIHVHEYGGHTELTFHIRFPSIISLKEAHKIATRIEQTIRDELYMESTIHMEPSDLTVKR